MDPKRSPPRNHPSVPRMDKRTFRAHYSHLKICMSRTWLSAMPQDSILFHFFPTVFLYFHKGNRRQLCYEQSKAATLQSNSSVLGCPNNFKDFHEFLTLLNWIQLATMIALSTISRSYISSAQFKQDKKLHRIQPNCLDEHPATPQRKPHFSSASRWRL